MKRFLVIIFGIIFIAVGVFIYFKNSNLIKNCTVEAEATVVDMKQEFSSDDSGATYLYYPIIEYELLKKALKILKPGCEMVYSTCSILQKENEDIISRVLKECKAKIVPIDIKIEDGIEILPTKINGTLCVMPNDLFEGFFIAKIIKEK